MTDPDLIGVTHRDEILDLLQGYSALRANERFNREEYRSILNDQVAPEIFDRGYLDLEVRGVEFSIDRVHHKVQPMIYLSEGDRYFIDKFEFEGVSPELQKLSEWKDIIRSAVTGRPYNQTQIEKLKNDFVRAVTAEGYLDAKAELKSALSNGRASLLLQMTTGPRYRIAQVLIRGAVRTKEKMLRKEAGLKPGDFFLEEEVRSAISRILRLGLARSLDIRVLERDPEAGLAYVLIDLVEAARFRFEFGPGYGTLDGFRGVFKATYANIAGTGRRLSLFAKANRKVEDSRVPDPADFLDVQEIPFIERKVTLEYFEPRLLDLPVDGRLTFSNQKQNFPLYGIFKNSFGAAIDYRFSRRLDFTTQYDLKYSDPFNVARGTKYSSVFGRACKNFDLI